MKRARRQLPATNRKDPKAIARSLVDRARLGDQNAMALLVMTARNAKSGNKTAIAARKYMLDYAKKNPSAAFSGDESITSNSKTSKVSRWLTKVTATKQPEEIVKAFDKAEKMGLSARQLCTALSHGCRLYGNTPIIDDLSKQYHQDNIPAFVAGVVNPSDENADFFGRCVGQARILQAVRSCKLPIKALSRRAGWELGE